LAAFCLTKSFLCNVVILLGMPFISESLFQKCASRSSKKILCKFQFREVGPQASVRTAQSCIQTPISVQKFRTVQGCIRPDVSTTQHARRSLVFNKKSNFLLKHRYGKTAASIQMTRQHRPDDSPYYGNYVQQKCNRPASRATLS